VVGVFERGNEPSGSIKCGEFIDKLRICWLLGKNSSMDLVSLKVRKIFIYKQNFALKVSFDSFTPNPFNLWTFAEFKLLKVCRDINYWKTMF
jgi:hypothetical protein